ncbi:MAG TPA: NAD(P)H-hydrate dehydratase [Tepidisphaeraceae bacterium]
MDRVTRLPALPTRPVEGHKGLFGRVLIVGGSDEMIGAPVLAGTSALRMGSGLVQIAVPKVILPAAISITPELIGLGLGKGAAKRRLLSEADKADAVVIGPGLGQSDEAAGRLMRLIRLLKPMVLDADGLNLLAAGKRWPKTFHAQAVLTPHPGEMKRLAKLIGRSEVPSDEQGRIDIATAASKAFGQVVVLKGYHTVVTDGSRVYVNDTGDSSLSKAGTGDVLSGIVGSLLGQKMDRFDAAVAGVWIHGKAGELAGERLGRRCVLARDVVDSIAAAIAAYEPQ